MTNVTLRDVFIAYKEYGSVQAAARAMKIKGSKVYYMQRKTEWKELEKEFEQGKLKVKKKNPKDLDNAASGSVAEKYFGKTISIENAPSREAPRLKVIKPQKDTLTKPVRKELIFEPYEEEREMTSTAEKNFEAEVERYEKGMKDLMDQLKAAEKAKEKVEIQRDAARNVNEQLEKRIDTAAEEINKYKAEKRKAAENPFLENRELDEVLKAENSRLKKINEELESKLDRLQDALSLEEKRNSEYIQKLAEERKYAEKLREDLEKYMELTGTQQADDSTEFYKDTAHLYHEKFKQGQMSKV